MLGGQTARLAPIDLTCLLECLLTISPRSGSQLFPCRMRLILIFVRGSDCIIYRMVCSDKTAYCSNLACGINILGHHVLELALSLAMSGLLLLFMTRFRSE